MPTDRRFEKLDSMPIPLEGGIDIPPDFDPGYDLQTKCDCGNEVWEPGEFLLGKFAIDEEPMTMKVNLCTSCKAPQMWVSRQYLKIKREEQNERRNNEKIERKVQTQRLFFLWRQRVRSIGRYHFTIKRTT